jgi:hypothetical protein
MGFDVLREFWPEVSRKLKLPFRDEHEVKPGESVPAERSTQPKAN